MKKRLILAVIIASLLFCTTSCKLFEYIAHVVICNVGDFAILASVDDSESIIKARSSETWELELDSADPVSVELYAELVNDPSENTSETITIGDREAYSWDVGWVVTANNKVILKKIKK